MALKLGYWKYSMGNKVYQHPVKNLVEHLHCA